MKTKIYTLIAITLMIASAFVGIGAMASSNDADTGTGTINSMSGTVDYVPADINITYNNAGSTATTAVASFSPAVNWSNVPTGDGYSLTSTAHIYTASTCLQAEEYDHDYSFAVSIIGTTVTITGDSAADPPIKTTDTLYIKVTSVISHNGIEIASRTTTAMSFNVNLYSSVSPIAPVEGVNKIVDPCYIGEAYEYDLTKTIKTFVNGASIIKTGSGTYTFVTDDLDGTGLYILGNSIMGTAVESKFTADYLTVDLTITDCVTGVVTTEVIKIPMKLTTVEVCISETNTSVDWTTSMSLTDGQTGYVDQGNTPTKTDITIKFTKYDSLSLTTPTLTDLTLGSPSITLSDDGPGIYKADLDTALIGTHAYVINYTINGYSDSFKFYLEVVANGSEFIIVPDITVTLDR